MRDSYCRRLILLGLGTAALSWPTLPVAAQAISLDPSTADRSIASSAPEPPDLQPEEQSATLAQDVATEDPSPSDPAAATPTESEERETLPLQEGGIDPTSDDPGSVAPDGDPETEAEVAPDPTGSGTTAFPARTEADLDYLNPHPNPLQLQTRPAEVEIVGTQPISLETAIELAYRNSEELRIAQLQLERSYEGLRAEQALRLPTADLNATLEVTDQTNFGLGLGNTATRLNSGIRTDYDLGVSGERAARIRAAEEQVRLAMLQVERTQVELRLNTITDYYAVQEASEQIRINQAFLQEAEDNLRITQLREQVGVGTRFDVLRAEVQVANARQNITQAQSQRDIAQRQLARRLNVPPSINLTTLGVEIQGTWPLSLEESIVLAYQNRGELEQFLVEREFNEAQRQVTLARTRPNVGLFAQYNFQALLITPEGVPTSTNDGFSLGAQLAWRLYDGGGTQARAAQSELDIRIDEFEFENIRNTIRGQVEEAYYTLQANQANINTATIAVNQAQQALRLANLRFEAGVGTQTDVLSATSELTQAEGNLVRAQLEYNRALARLERAVSNLSPLTR
ncbi:TolC family protein [Phormidium sp. FACHB-1136]|uniref:TolC family protein n=1 Tax=Phormidium sp. FACHB-1136 TaxID=2692848 RepID=UPI00168260E2|nr:TolC family protein [Phormidium sp. FACHB-1136]MBD2426081.1 TolC family protein [Phormidium sp. FACHB-1136]